MNRWPLALLAIVMIIHSAVMIGKALKMEPRPSFGWRGWMMFGWFVIGICAIGASHQLLWISGACFALAMLEKYVSGTNTGALSWLRFRWVIGLPLILLKSAPSVLVFAIRRPRSVGEVIRGIIAHYRLNLDHPLSREEVSARSGLTPQAALNLWRMEGKAGQRLDAAKLGVWIEAASKPETEEQREARQQFERREAVTKARNEEIAALVATLPADSPGSARRVAFRLMESEVILLSGGDSVEVPAGDYDGLLSVGSLSAEEAEENDFFSLPCTFEFRFNGSNYRVHSWMRCADFHPTAEGVGDAPTFWWKEALPNWQQQFKQGLLVTRQRGMNDSRVRVPFPQAGPGYSLFTKYLTWEMDLAASGDGRKLLVRVCDLTVERSRQEVEPGFGDESDREFDDIETLAPICLEIPVEEVIPLTNPDRHASQAEGEDGALMYEKSAG